MTRTSRDKAGIINGRFQPFHLEHLEYALAAKKKCEHLIVGLTNPDPIRTSFNLNDPSRSLELNNPLTYWERQELIYECLISEGIKSEELSFVPFPINFPELIKYYVPPDSRVFLTIYDDWGKHKKAALEENGLKVFVLWEKNSAEKKITSSMIRANIAAGLPWEHLVPNKAVQFIKAHNIHTRIQTLYR